MAFKKQSTDLDLETTPIENIFISEFLPMANGTAVKVYLMAYFLVNSDKDFTNKTLAKNLNIPLEDVLRSWDFWADKGIIKKVKTDKGYDVEFISLRQMTAKGMFQNTKSVPVNKTETGNNLNLIEANKNPEIRKMFYQIDQLMKRELVPNERITVLNWIYKQNVNMDIIVRAFKYSVEDRNIKHLKYVSAVVQSWHDKGILTLDDLEDYFAKKNSNYNHYKQIYMTLGYANKLPSAGDIEVMNVWLDDYKFDIQYLIRILTDASKRTSNINMNYMHKVVENLYQAGIDSLEKYQQHLEKKKSKPAPKDNKSPKKNSFLDIQGSKKKYTKEELEKRLGIRK